MEKLKLEHLAPYLPYKLKISTQYGINVPKEGLTYTVIGVCKKDTSWSNGEIDIVFEVYEKYGKEMSNAYFDFKPILRPLSDIGDVPGKYLSEESNLDIGDQITLSELSNKEMNFAHLEYHLAVHLFENHFDCFGLIDAGLAIDINTLKK